MEDIAVKHNQELMKQQNLKLVLSVIKNRGPISRAEISRIVNMSPTSVGRMTEVLLDAGLLREAGTAVNKVGRKASLLEVDAASVLSIGVEVDKGYIGAGIVDFHGRIVEKAEIDDLTLDTPAEVAVKIGELVRQLLSGTVDKNRIIGLGAVFPGLIGMEKGEVSLSAQLKWENVRIGSLLQERIPDFPITIDNEMKAKALAESFYRDAQSTGRIALLNIGSGVGSALLINNRVYRGNSNYAGEIGHITIDPKGHLCECGRFGCLQTYIVEQALVEEARKVKNISAFGELYQFFMDGEPWAQNIIHRAVEYIGAAIGTLICLYNPDTVVVSGRLISKYPGMAALVEKTYRQYIWEPLLDTFKLKLAADFNNGIIGAGALAFLAGMDEYIL